MNTIGSSFEAENFGFPSPFVLTAVHVVYKGEGGGGSRTKLKKDWVLDYSVMNCGHCRVGSETEPWLPRGNGIAHLYPPNTKYWEDLGSVPLLWSSTYIIFSGGGVVGFDKLTSNLKGFARFLDTEGTIGTLLREMAVMGATQGDDVLCAVMERFYRIAGLLKSAQPQPSGFEFSVGPAEVEPHDAFAAKVNQLMAGKLDEPLSLSHLSKALGISSSTLSHKYRKAAGESPLQAHLGLRINLAKGLLLKGESLKSAAAKTGFYDEFNFSRTFKRLVGLNPSEYAKRSGSIT